MAEHKKGEIAYIGNPIFMNGDSNLESKSDDDACYRRLKLKMNEPVLITAVHRSKTTKGKVGAATYDVIYERDGVKYRILNLPEFNLWSKKGWELCERLKAEKAEMEAELRAIGIDPETMKKIGE